MADTTWLQCTMPRPEWEKLNERREKLSIKWAQLIPGAVEAALTRLEAHPDEVAKIVGAKVEKPAQKPKAKKEAKQLKKAKIEKNATPPNPDKAALPTPLASTTEELDDLANIK